MFALEGVEQSDLLMGSDPAVNVLPSCALVDLTQLTFELLVGREDPPTLGGLRHPLADRVVNRLIQSLKVAQPVDLYGPASVRITPVLFRPYAVSKRTNNVARSEIASWTVEQLRYLVDHIARDNHVAHLQPPVRHSRAYNGSLKPAYCVAE